MNEKLPDPRIAVVLAENAKWADHMTRHAWCSRCRESLPKERFNKNASTKNGLQNYCKECHAEVISDRSKREAHVSLPDVSQDTTKTCNTCGEEKNVSEFGKRANYVGGRAHKCKTCVNNRQNLRNAASKSQPEKK